MITLVGNGSGQRPVLGWAVNVTYLDRRPTIDTATIARLRKSVEVDETALDIVLVVDRVDVGLWMPLPLGSTLVGIVTQQPFPVDIQNPLDIPCVHVSELPDEAIADGMLVLVDPLRNLVLVEPTADELVRIQITRKTRYAIGDGHIPVHTRGGVNIPIYAEIAAESDIAVSLSQGADGLAGRACGPHPAPVGSGGDRADRPVGCRQSRRIGRVEFPAKNWVNYQGNQKRRYRCCQQGSRHRHRIGDFLKFPPTLQTKREKQIERQDFQNRAGNFQIGLHQRSYHSQQEKQNCGL